MTFYSSRTRNQNTSDEKTIIYNAEDLRDLSVSWDRNNYFNLPDGSEGYMNGEGEVMAIIDTGINAARVNKNLHPEEAIHIGGVTHTTNSHGTAVANAAIDYAPDAEVLHFGVSRESGSHTGSQNNAERAYRWIIENGEEYGITGVNYSMGGTYVDEAGNSSYETYYAALDANNVIVTLPMGNHGDTPVGVDWQNNPGDYYNSNASDGHAIEVSWSGVSNGHPIINHAGTSRDESVTDIMNYYVQQGRYVETGHPTPGATGSSIAAPTVLGTAMSLQSLSQQLWGVRLDKDVIIDILQQSGGELANYDGDAPGYKAMDREGALDLLLSYAYDDKLIGDNGANNLVGGAGEDTLNGAGGNDLLDGGNDNDHLKGGAGDDRLLGKDGNDTLNGQAGGDVLVGGAGDDILIDTSGDNIFKPGRGADTIQGGNGDDKVVGAYGPNEIKTADGRDIILDGNGSSYIDGGAGSDRIEGRAGDDTIDGGVGNDFIDGQDGDDDLYGGDGNDIITGGLGEDTLNGGEGNDRLIGGDAEDRITGGEGDDNVIKSGTGDDYVLLGDGDDYAMGNHGDDFIHGGNGDDKIQGGTGDDLLVSAWGDDTVIGGTGDDTIRGGDGDDILDGKQGDDVLIGGDGADEFIFDSEQNGHNTIEDYDPEDVIILDGQAVEIYGLSGVFTGNAVQLGDGLTATYSGEQNIVKLETAANDFSVQVNVAPAAAPDSFDFV